MLPESPPNVPSPVGRDVSFDDPSTKMSFSDAKTLLTLQKSNLYLQQETKIIKNEERRADDPNSGAFPNLDHPHSKEELERLLK